MKIKKSKNLLEVSILKNNHPKINEIIKECSIDLNEWNLTKKSISKWDIQQKTKDEKIITKPCFSTKITLERKNTFINDLEKDFFEKLKNNSPVVDKFNYNLNNTNPKYLLQINIFDLHFGKLSWNKETNNNYDTKIAKELIYEVIANIINKTKNFNIEKILFPIGNDFFNSDKSFPYNSTTAGTFQEEDLRWQRTFLEGKNLLITIIDKLSKIAPVDVVIIPGNHDFERSFYLGDTLYSYYYNNKNISINNSPNPRKYYTYGKVLLGFTHGSEEKHSNLPLIMAQEFKDWSKYSFREWHIGHLHYKKDTVYNPSYDNNGVIIRQLSSISGSDSWHHKKGYVCSKKMAESYLWDCNKGLEYLVPINI